MLFVVLLGYSKYGSVSRMSGWSRDRRFFKKLKVLLTFPFNLVILAFIFAFSDFLHQPSTRTWKAFDDAKIKRLVDSSENCICQTMITFPAIAGVATALR